MTHRMPHASIIIQGAHSSLPGRVIGAVERLRKDEDHVAHMRANLEQSNTWAMGAMTLLSCRATHSASGFLLYSIMQNTLKNRVVCIKRTETQSKSRLLTCSNPRKSTEPTFASCSVAKLRTPPILQSS